MYTFRGKHEQVHTEKQYWPHIYVSQTASVDSENNNLEMSSCKYQQVNPFTGKNFQAVEIYSH